MAMLQKPSNEPSKMFDDELKSEVNSYEKDISILEEAFSQFNMKVIPQRRKLKSRLKESE